MPTAAGYNYRDVPSTIKDSDGYYGTDCKYASRPSVDCGGGGTIAVRIADCLAKNAASATWNGATQCNGGQGEWKLVSRTGANIEVWQDQRTGLIWSSYGGTSVNWCQASGNTELVPLTFRQAYNNTTATPMTGNGTIGAITSGASAVAETITITMTSNTTFTVSGANCGGGAITAGGLTGVAGSTVTWSRAGWCSFTLTQGAVNFAANDIFILRSEAAATYSCAPNAASGLQPAAYVSYCAEVAGAASGFAGENWAMGTYHAAKGGMGKNSADKVMWRLPTISDYQTANVNGIRMVMPDMGAPGTSRTPPDGSTGGNTEWSASLFSNPRNASWHFNGSYGSINTNTRNNSFRVRCVGR